MSNNVNFNDLTLRDLMEFEKDAGVSFAKAVKEIQEAGGMPSIQVAAALIKLSKKQSGEIVTIDEILDSKLSEINFIIGDEADTPPPAV